MGYCRNDVNTDALIPPLTCRQLLESAEPLLGPEDLLQVLRKNPDTLVREAIADWIYDPASGLEKHLWRIARHHLRRYDASDADSVVADGILDVIDHIQQGKPILVSLKALLSRITTCRAISFARVLKNRPSESIPGDYEVSSWPCADREIDQELLQSAIDRLKPTHRDVIILIYFQGYTVTQAAAHLGIPPGTAKSRLNRALAELRDSFPELSD